MEKAPYFEGYIRTGWLKLSRAYVLIYKKSLVICFVRRAEVSAEKKRIKPMIKEKHLGWLKAQELLQSEMAEYGDRFAKMDDKTARLQDIQNREIRYEDIEAVQYSPATEDCDGEMNIFCRGRLKIVTAEGKTIIQHSLEKGAPQEQVLRRALDRIDTKGRP